MNTKESDDRAVSIRVLEVFKDVLGLEALPAEELELAELEISSMDAMALTITLEQEFDGTLADDALATLVTVSDVVRLIKTDLGAA